MGNSPCARPDGEVQTTGFEEAAPDKIDGEEAIAPHLVFKASEDANAWDRNGSSPSTQTSWGSCCAVPTSADGEIQEKGDIGDDCEIISELTHTVPYGCKPGSDELSLCKQQPVAKSHWDSRRPIIMALCMILISVASAFFDALLEPDVDGPTFVSFLKYGSIPIIAAVIGYGTNVVALLMMFYPIDFIGFFPDAKIGCGLDLPLFGWQGVIPMKAREMAEITVDLMTQKLIKIDEIFGRLKPWRVGKEVADVMPEVVAEVMSKAGRTKIPRTWEHMPAGVRDQLTQSVIAEAPALMSRFIADLQKNIYSCFDLKHCVVKLLVENKHILNDIFLTCGETEFEFIRNSGFYLGYMFGILQMLIWLFVKSWWILPLCGVFVGYFTNVVALKAIFLPVEPKKLLGGRLTVQGLFLTRQVEVSKLYAKSVSTELLTAKNLMQALIEGPRNEAMMQLVDKHVSDCMEDKAKFYKPAFLLTMGAEVWIDFRTGVCEEFRLKLPVLFATIEDYAQHAMNLEETLRCRLINLSATDFERLLHAVFEQDEIKLILVGAILGAIVGFLQAIVQTPEQLGITLPW